MHVLKMLFFRLVWVGLVLMGLSVVAFLLVHSIPGNPWYKDSQKRAMLTYYLDPISIRYLNRQFGLDRPLWQQYVRYMFGGKDADGNLYCGAICGNLGPSLRQRGRSVQSILFYAPEDQGFWHSRFGYTARLALYSFILTPLLGIPLGILMALSSGKLFDRFMSGVLLFSLCIPNFIYGILLIIILGSWLRLVKIVPQWSEPQSWIMPVLVLAIVPAASLAQLTRTAMRSAIQGEYVRTAHAKGLRKLRIVICHILPNALVPIVTALAPVLVELVAGSFIVESVFGFPGIGREYWQAVAGKDYPVIMGLTLLYSLGMLMATMVAEALYGIVDPRIRGIEA